MFNDIMNVAASDEQRRKALQRLAQQLQANAARSSALGATAGAANAAGFGGGLGNQQRARFRPLAAANMGSLQRFFPGGRPDYGAAIGRFGIVQRQPGARDPGAIPDLGGAPATVGSTAPGGGITPPGVGGGPAPYVQPGVGGPDGAGAAIAAHGEGGSSLGGGVPGAPGVTPLPQITPDKNFGAGYVNYQGVPVPLALFKAMQLGLGG